MLLAKLIDDADQVIINGDFWDRTFTNFNGFVNSRWKLLFPLLKSKHTIYIYGNHDREQDIDERVMVFSDQQVYEYELEYNGNKLLITHGHTIRQGLAIFSTIPLVKYLQKPAQNASDILEWFSTKFMRRFGKNIFLHRYLDNRSIRKFSRTLPPKDYLVCGHTHLAFYSPISQYINIGSIRFGHAHYLVVDKDKLKLNYQRY